MTRSMTNLLKNTASLGLALLATAAAVPAIGQSPYKVEQQWKLGGDGGWDYLAVDPASHLIYITRGDRVLIVDPSAGKKTGEISGLKGTHGVVFDARDKYGYITDGGANMVRVFDRKSHAIVTSIQAGTNPDGAVFEPVTKTVWAFNGRSKNATDIDATTNQAIATVGLPGKPEFPVADGKGTVFANIEDMSELVRIDAKTHTVTATWPLAPCESPSGLAIDAAHRRLFSVCDNKLMAVIDADTGKVIATPAIGDGPDAAGFDPNKQLAFSSNGEGNLTVVKENSPSKFSVVQTLATKRGARTMTLDPSTGKLYLVTADFGPRPSPTTQNPHPRPSIVPGSFEVLVLGQ